MFIHLRSSLVKFSLWPFSPRIGRATVRLLLALTVPLSLSTLQAADFSGRVSDFHGYARHDFQHDGMKCIIVVPKTTAEGRPWVLRARFFGHEPAADKELLKRGFHITYCEVGNLFGNPEAVQRWDRFYAYLINEHDFGRKVALEGMSRGGLIIYNWAAANPDKVACLYGDAPVCDIRSWPGGKGKGKGGGGAWGAALKAYGLTEEESVTARVSPIDHLQPIAAAKIPILHVVGDADVVVPVEENTDIVVSRYRALGGSIRVISKPGVGHHPHALKDPTPIVEFIVEHTTKSP